MLFTVCQRIVATGCPVNPAITELGIWPINDWGRGKKISEVIHNPDEALEYIHKVTETTLLCFSKNFNTNSPYSNTACILEMEGKGGSHQQWKFLGQNYTLSLKAAPSPSLKYITEVDCSAWFWCKLLSTWSRTSLCHTALWCQYSALREEALIWKQLFW